ncbi:DNA integration/recombination/inversion protein [Octadecabacter antarcticus 307]|uniref:DNA integration/recombination/inversion protein n=1 Tax=Octadecabacter antarcticus 307 TaxID=391626 RepID=M9R9X2_9RHOB|nr:site-specific integrase [Octadecabacter antarcticus]AGI68613.1 DNA integration/recombination/inversion protein [Octadecabacter antarcticus 307]
MPKVVLTEITLKSLPPPVSGQTTYWDKTTSGFGVRVSQGGSKSFVIVHGVNRQRETLGRHPTITLKQARDQAKKLLAQITLGVQQSRTISYKDARDLFLEACEAKNKRNTVDYYRKRLDTHFRFGRKRLDEITRTDIQSRIRKIKTSTSEQNHAFVVIRTLMNWALAEQHVDQSPIASLKPPVKPQARDHVLTDYELIQVFKASQEQPYPFGPIVSLLVLTGMRRNEVASMKWDWIDRSEQTIIIPADVTKNKRVHSLPYADLVEAVLETIPEIGPYLFPSRSKTGTIFNGWGKSKERFDASLEDIMPYTLHDLRRTFATTHAKIGTPIHVTEKLLNHVSGTISGVAAVYNRHSYMDQMRTAVTGYDIYLKNLSNPR